MKNKILLTLNTVLGCICCYSSTFLDEGNWFALAVCVIIAIYMTLFLWVNTRDSSVND